MSHEDGKLRICAGSDDPAHWEGFEIYRDDEGNVNIDALYDSGYESIGITLDAAQVQQLRDLLA